jgi:hypothetical protein
MPRRLGISLIREDSALCWRTTANLEDLGLDTGFVAAQGTVIDFEEAVFVGLESACRGNVSLFAGKAIDR